MLEVDLSWLMGGKSFTICCILSRNGYRVNTTTLANTRANAFTLLNTRCIVKLSEFLNTPLEPLENLIPIKGYNGNTSTPITLVLQTHFKVNGRR
jgi:hypothetical protein